MVLSDHTFISSFISLAYANHYGLLWEFELLRKIDPSEVVGYDSILPRFSKLIDDDSFMAAFSLIYAWNQVVNGSESTNLHDALVQWAKEYGVGIGNHTKSVLLEQNKNLDSQGNGFLMRNIPAMCLLIDAGIDGQSAVDIINKESFITHKNDVVCGVNSLVFDILTCGIEATSYQKHEKTVALVESANSCSQTAWVLTSLKIALEALQWNLPFKDSLKRIIIDFKGDTDTNCAIFGALYGALYGPDEEIYIDELHDLLQDFIHQLIDEHESGLDSASANRLIVAFNKMTSLIKKE